MTEIILAAKIRYSDGETVRTLGVTDAPYLGPASGLEGSVWWPLLDPDADTRWAEHARHPYQGQPPPLEIGDLILINSSGFFDPWIGFTVAGLEIEVQRGPINAEWNDEADRWDAFHAGKFEPVFRALGGRRRFEGRSRFVIGLQSVLEPLGEALIKDVFDDIDSPLLEGRRAPLVFGFARQIAPLAFLPNDLVYYTAQNAVGTISVAEGGNAETPQWEDWDPGFRLLASPTLAITADIAGPEKPGSLEDNLLDSIGSFDSFTGDDPDGWTVATTPTLSAVADAAPGLDVTATASDQTGDWKLGGNATAFVVGDKRQAEWVNPDNALADDTNDATASLQVFVTGGGVGISITISERLTVSGFDFDLPENAIITGFEVGILCRDFAQTGAGAEPAVEIPQIITRIGNRERTKVEPQDMPRDPDPYAELLWGGPTDLWGQEPTRENINGLSIGFVARRDATVVGTVVARIRRVRVRAYYTIGQSNVRLWTDVEMEPGQRYRLRVVADDGVAEDDLSIRVAGVDAISDPLPGGSAEALILGEDEDADIDFVPEGPVLAVSINATDGVAQRVIQSLALTARTLARSKYAELVPYVVELAGQDPETAVDQAMIEAHATASQDPTLGWYISGAESADDLLFLFAGSLGGMIWHGLDGRVRSMLLQPPTPSEKDEALRLEGGRITGSVDSDDDDPPEITDRVHAARNFAPLSPDRTAGITSTWTEQDRADVSADYRVTRRARFPELLGFEAPVITP